MNDLDNNAIDRLLAEKVMKVVRVDATPGEGGAQ